MTMTPRLLVCNAPHELRWKGQLGVPGIFDGEHSFQLSALDSGKTLFRHGEKFSGFLVPLVFRGALKRGSWLGRKNPCSLVHGEIGKNIIAPQ